MIAAGVRFVVALFILSFYAVHVVAFAPVRSNITMRQSRRNRFSSANNSNPAPALYASTPSDNDGDSQSASDDGIDLDQQKLALENMLKNGSETDETSNVSKSKSILTSTRKQRLEREIQLLKQLDPEHPENNSEYSDLQNQEIVVSELWGLWYGERGPMNGRILRAIDESLGDPESWPDAENSYLELIQEHCTDDGDWGNLTLQNWVEPANRLATLYFIMGRLDESKVWCERILGVKPWHMGALSGVVMVCMKMSDTQSVMKYSLMGLPNLSLQMRKGRQEWVQQNVQIAERNLSQLEELNKKAYGEPDESRVNFVERSTTEETADPIAPETEDIDSAWQ